MWNGKVFFGFLGVCVIQEVILCMIFKIDLKNVGLLASSK